MPRMLSISLTLFTNRGTQDSIKFSYLLLSSCFNILKTAIAFHSDTTFVTSIIKDSSPESDLKCK